MTSPQSSPAVAAGFPIDATLRMAWRLSRVSFLACLPLALLGICASGAPQAFALTTGHSLDLAWWLVYAAGALLTLLCYGAIILRQQGLLSAAGLVAAGVPGVPSVPSVPSGNLVMALLRSAQRLPAVMLLMLPALPLMIVGLALLLLPGVALGVCLLLAWPTLLLERESPLGAMRQASWRLRGQFWRVLATFAIAAAGVLVFVVLAGVFVGVIMLTAQGNASSAGERALGTLVQSLIMVPPVLYLCAVIVVVRLRLLASDHQHR